MENYLLVSSASLLLFYTIYRIILWKETNSQIKRVLGLVCIIFSSIYLLVPDVHLASSEDTPFLLQEVTQTSASIQQSIKSAVSNESNSTSQFIIIYIVGVVGFSLRFLGGIFHLTFLYLRSEKIKRWGFTVVACTKRVSPFTFFNLLFISRDDLKRDDIEALIIHEQFHRNQLHSIDTLLLQFFGILYWFNPVIWLFQKDIKAEHEFMADEEVLKKGFDKLDYQQLLFKERTGISFQAVNYLSSQTSLKQRFNMMEKAKMKTKHSQLRVASLLTILAMTLLVTSFSPVIVEQLDSSDTPTFKIFTENGEVDLEKGISKTTEKLYLRAIPQSQESTIGYLVSKAEITLVEGGLGRGVVRGSDSIEIQSLLGATEKLEKAILLLEIIEYMTKGEDDVVNKVELEKKVFIEIPIF